MAKRADVLPLHEEVALLALKNDRGTVAGGVMYAQAAGGAILAELLLSGHLTSETVGKKVFAVAARPARTGSDVLDECLDKVAQSKRRATLTAWVQRFGGVKALHHRVARSLIEKGILREDEGRILFLFTRRTYPELDPRAEQAIRMRIEGAILAETATVDPRTSVLIAIAQHSGLLKTNFDRAQLKARKARIAMIAKGEAVGDATRQAIEAVQAAVLMAVIIPAIVASSASH